jgi:hypothetical protein
VQVSRPQAPVTAKFDDTLTVDMFGDVVCVTTTLDSLGADDYDDDDDDDDDNDKTARAQGAAAHSVDRAQKYAYSFQAVKDKMDAVPLTTKRQRKAQRNKSHATLEGKAAKTGKAAGTTKGPGGGRFKKAEPADAKTLTAKAIKTANFGKKKKPRASEK